VISAQWQQNSSRLNELSEKHRPVTPRTCFFPLSWHIAIVALHSGTRFLAVPHIIPAAIRKAYADREIMIAALIVTHKVRYFFIMYLFVSKHDTLNRNIWGY
jgi:hypothetical protein